MSYEWQPIETFPGDTRYTSSENCPGTRFYDDVLIYGPTWGGGWTQRPHDGDEFWTGEAGVFKASTYSGQGFFRVCSSAPCDYDEYVRATHWMPLPATPAAAESGRE